jgi:hypothetical protein
MMCHCITTLGHDVCKIIATNVNNMMAGIGIPTAVMDTASDRHFTVGGPFAVA